MEEDPIQNDVVHDHQSPMGMGMEIENSESGASSDCEEDDERTHPLRLGNYQIFTFRRRFCRSSAADVQEAWPAIESALNESGMAGLLDLDHYFITLFGDMNIKPGSSDKARCALQLLSIRVPACQALRVLKGVPCDITETGFQIYGLCRYRMETAEYLKRKKHLRAISDAEQDLKVWTGCDIYVRPKVDLVAAIGPVAGLRIIKKLVIRSIVHNEPPGPVFTKVKMLQAQIGIEELSLG